MGVPATCSLLVTVAPVACGHGKAAAGCRQVLTHITIEIKIAGHGRRRKMPRRKRTRKRTSIYDHLACPHCGGELHFLRALLGPSDEGSGGDRGRKSLATACPSLRAGFTLQFCLRLTTLNLASTTVSLVRPSGPPRSGFVERIVASSRRISAVSRRSSRAWSGLVRRSIGFPAIIASVREAR